MIHLDKRLQEIANLVDANAIIADIGTDHGYLPIYLVQQNIINKAYACDISYLCLKKAKENITKENLQDKITPVLNDGIKNLSPEIDTIIISGMGGHLISEIIKNCKYPTLILQANSHVEVVRQAIMENNYKIIDEKIVFHNKKYYEIIKAIKKEAKYTPLQLKYGPINLVNKSEMFINKIIFEIDYYRKILKKLSKENKDYDKYKSKIIELEKIIKK